jgi:hypothetical protein
VTFPVAHETWFEHARPSADWGFAFEGVTLALLAAALLVTVAVRLLARRFPGVDVPFLGRAAPWMPFAVRMHLAVSLVTLLSLGYYLSPAMDLHFDVAGVLLGAVMVLVAISMATGWHTREAAWLLVAAGPLEDLPGAGMAVLRDVDDGEARRLAEEEDESVVQGLFLVRIRPWLVLRTA